MKRALLAAIMAVLTGAPVQSAQVKKLTMAEAVELALKQNHNLKVARFKVQEAQQEKAGAKSQYFPTLSNETNLLHVTELQDIDIPAGAFGRIPEVGPSPPHDLFIDQGKTTVVGSGTSLTQPITQLIRVHRQNKAAEADVASSRDEARYAEVEVALKVHEMYYNLLVAQLNRQAAEQQMQYADEDLRESANEVENGSALKVTEISSQASELESKQTLLTADLQIDDLNVQFDDLLGLPVGTKLELDPAVKTEFALPPKDQCLRMAWAQNPEIRSAEDSVTKASAGVSVARTKFIPDVTAFARYSYQDGIPFLVHNFGTFGVSMNYDIFDFGRRRADIRQEQAQLREAEENLARLKDEVAVQVEQTYNKLQRTKSMVEVAQRVVDLRTEGERLASNQVQQGVVLVSEQRKASAEAFKAQADLLQASLTYVLARAELDRTMGVVSQF
ncbi:MAG TPA: TolC family protein [Terriglobia bacterium]|jgi:outer membrane protein TolC|nr:TolC family protein [Terriglobia bacterium]